MSQIVVTPVIFPADSTDLRRYDTGPRPLIHVQISWTHTSSDGDDHGYRSERFESGPDSVRQTAPYLLRILEGLPVWWMVGTTIVHWRDLLTLLEADSSAFRVDWTHGAEWLLPALRQCEYGSAVGIELFRSDLWTDPMEIARSVVRSSVHRSDPAVDFAVPLWMPGWSAPARPVPPHLAAFFLPPSAPAQATEHTVARTTENKGAANRIQVWLETPVGFVRFHGQPIAGVVDVLSRKGMNNYRSEDVIRTPAGVRVWSYEIEFRGDRRWIHGPDGLEHCLHRPTARMSSIPEAARPLMRELCKENPLAD